MGSRSGFIVKKNGVAKAYGSRHGGSSTVQWLIQGPEVATKKFINEGELDELDDVLGGEDGWALIDWDDKVVMWRMGNCRWPVQHRLCNRMIGQAFEGWDVRQSYDLYELTEYVGIDTSKYVSVDENEPIDLQLTPDDVRIPVDVPNQFQMLDELDDPGVWITVRQQEGALKDYFGFHGDSLWNCLLLGERLVDQLSALPTFDRIPHELLTTEGAVIDVEQKVLWRWQGGRVDLLEQIIAKIWDGWTLKDVPGGSWKGHVEVTGREPENLGCKERDILAGTVKDVAPYALDSDSPGLGKMVGTARYGCVFVTLLMGLAGAGFYYLSQSIWIAVVFGILFVLCLYVTVWVYRKSTKVITTLGLDIDPKEWNAKVDKILVGLGYPTIEQLKASGELSEPDDDDWDEDDEE